MKRLAIACILCLICLCGTGQVRLLTLNEYLSLVKSYHPLALQAGLTKDKAMYARRQAFGSFDPKLEINSEQKVFDGKTYYDYLVPEVKLPLWYGMDVKASYTTYTGEYVNPENKVPKEGLSYLGVAVPLGKGLFIDDRRAALKQAAIYQNVAANDQRQMINDLFINATHTYAEWLNAWLNTRVYEQAAALAELRLAGIRLLYKNGDRPAIDTLEALTVLQGRLQKFGEYQTLLVNKKNELATYLWLDNLTPADPATLNLKPDTTLVSLKPADSLLLKEAAAIAAQNPEVTGSGLKLDELKLERKVKLEEIKPTFNLTMGVLSSGRNPIERANANAFKNNQKLGFTVSMPLTFTKQRAAYGMSKIKVREAEYALADKRNRIAAKWENYRNEVKNLDEQILVYTAIQKNNKRLLDGEEIKFKMGESSVFLVNAREQKLLENQEKLNDIYIKRIKTIQYLNWLANSW